MKHSLIAFIALILFFTPSAARSGEKEQKHLLNVIKKGDNTSVFQSSGSVINPQKTTDVPKITPKITKDEISLKTTASGKQKKFTKKRAVETAPQRDEERSLAADKSQIATAWELYRNEDYGSAAEIFSLLSKSGDTATALDAMLGLAYCHINLGQHSEALVLFEYLSKERYKLEDVLPNLVETAMFLERFDKAEKYIALMSDDIKTVYRQRLKERELNLYRSRLASLKAGSAEIEHLANKILSLNPGDPSAQGALAWFYHSRSEHEKALRLFSDLNARFPAEQDYILGMSYSYLALNRIDDALKLIENQHYSTKKWNDLKLTVYMKKAQEYYDKKDYSKAFSFAEKLAMSDERDLNRAAADFYCRYNLPITAAQTDKDNQSACYYKEQFPDIQGTISYRQKSGDPGFSKLQEYYFPLSVNFPAVRGEKWTFSIKQRHLSSGIADTHPYMGNYYKYLNGQGQIHSPVTSVWLWQPEIGFEKEGHTRYSISLGASPMNAPVSAIPVFSATVAQNNWRLGIHQKQVDESILSFAGQKDPYSNNKWGRVVKTGVTGEITFDLSDSYWLTVSGGYDYLWGKNVWSNNALSGTISAGRTFNIDKSDINLGLFLTAQHFTRNTGFFTFGHGGYFSPQQFLMAGPSARYTVKSCCSYTLDIKASAGFIHYKTNESPHYPLLNESVSLALPAQNDIYASYKAEKVSKIGGSFEVQWKKSFKDSGEGIAFIRGNLSSNYNEWLMGIALRFFFIPAHDPYL